MASIITTSLVDGYYCGGVSFEIKICTAWKSGHRVSAVCMTNLDKADPVIVGQADGRQGQRAYPDPFDAEGIKRRSRVRIEFADNLAVD